MKDAVHHLKHVQKKVIQSVRKSQVSEENLPKKEINSSNYPLEMSNPSKRAFK
jgi:hypothetical protein